MSHNLLLIFSVPQPRIRDNRLYIVWWDSSAPLFVIQGPINGEPSQKQCTEQLFRYGSFGKSVDVIELVVWGGLERHSYQIVSAINKQTKRATFFFFDE